MHPKELVKQLKSNFTDPSISFASLEPPDEVLRLVEAFIADQEFDSAQERLLLAVNDISASVHSLWVQGKDEGRYSAWVVTLAALLTPIPYQHVQGKEELLEFLDALWNSPTALLRPVFLPDSPNAAPISLGRTALAAARSLLIWCCASHSPQGDAPRPSDFEKTLLQDYLRLVQHGHEAARMEALILALAKASPKTLLQLLQADFATSADSRLGTLGLLLLMVKQQPSIAHHLSFKDLLICFLVEMDPFILSKSFHVILAVVPELIASLRALLPDLFAVYAKAIYLNHQLRPLALAPQYDGLDKPETPQIVLPELSDDIVWNRVDAGQDHWQSLPVDRLFSYLYGLLPCTFAEFLKDPTQTLAKLQWHSPLSDRVKDSSIGLHSVLALSEPLLARHLLQPVIFISDLDREIDSIQRTWSKSNSAAFVAHCESLVVDDTSCRPTGRFASTSRTESLPDVTDMASPKSRASSLSYSQIGDLYSSSSSPSAASVSQAHASLNAALTQKDLAKKASLLERLAVQQSHLLWQLQGELQFEQHLRAQHQQTLGVLHRQKTLESGFEAERQTLYQTLRHLRITLAERQSQLDRQRTEASAARVSHTTWANSLRQKAKVLKEDNRSLRMENEEIAAQLSTAKAQLAEQATELEEVGSRMFDMSGESEANQSRIIRIAELEESASKMTTALFLWRQDLTRRQEREQQYEELQSEYQKACQTNETLIAESNKLRAQLQGMDDQLQDTRAQLEAKSREQAASRPVSFRAGLTDSAYEVLRNAYEELRTKHSALLESVAEGGSSKKEGDAVNG